MADYHPLVDRAVAGLDDNTSEARRALYERARSALVAQLRGVTPALSESDITRERLALEEAIRKVEAEQLRRGRSARPQPAPQERKSEPEAPQITAPISDAAADAGRHVEVPAASASAAVVAAKTE